jgi:tRNA(Glu) U13 pseudouridine synthase TruD
MSEGAVYPATGGLPTKVSGVPLKRSDRAAAVVATNLSITDLTCRLAEGRVVVAVSLSYDLPSSCYATIFLASLFGVMPIG